MNKKIEYHRWVASIVFIIILFICIPHMRKITLAGLLGYMPHSIILAALMLLGIYCIKVIMMFIPLSLLFVCAGIIFPPCEAIVITYICLTIEMTIGFYIGRFLGTKHIIKFINKSEKGRKILEYSNNNGVLSCFFLRFAPGLPADLSNMFMGTTDVKYRQFIGGSLLGDTTFVIPFVLMGAAVTNPFSAKFMIPLGISLVVTICTLFVYQKTRKKLIIKESDRSN